MSLPNTTAIQDYANYGVTQVEDKQKLFRLIKGINHNDGPTYKNSQAYVDDGSPKPNLISTFSQYRSTEGTSEDKGVGESPDPLDKLVGNRVDRQDTFLLSLTNDECGDKLGSKYGNETTDERLYQGAGELCGTRPLSANIASCGGVARIRVVVRKRPMNKKEKNAKEAEIISIEKSLKSVTVHETRTRVDLAKYIEKHEFLFDDALDEDATNDTVFCSTVEPLIHSIFQNGKATCFAYGQTGSGKTYTISPMPRRTVVQMLEYLTLPEYSDLELWVSNFEIYHGKLYDLLGGRKRLIAREDSSQNVCIVGLREFVVTEISLLDKYLEIGTKSRSTGSTGANDESSRSHAILQLALRKKKASKDSSDSMSADVGGEAKRGKIVGKLSFIDLAGSERGADTYDNDRRTRLEGAAINKSLLALKECIRALDQQKAHIPFRGSKLTEVLRDSFTGNSRTVMIANIAPNSMSCENTLNTLRYAYRVKEISKTNPADLSEGHASVRHPLAARMEAGSSISSESFEATGPYQSGLEMLGVDKRRSFMKERSEDCKNILTKRHSDLISQILQEEEDLINSHKSQIDETMECVKTEMQLLAEFEEPASQTDVYVNTLAVVLKRKIDSIMSFLEKVEQFREHLVEEEALSSSIKSN